MDITVQRVISLTVATCLICHWQWRIGHVQWRIVLCNLTLHCYYSNLIMCNLHWMHFVLCHCHCQLLLVVVKGRAIWLILFPNLLLALSPRPFLVVVHGLCTIRKRSHLRGEIRGIGECYLRILIREERRTYFYGMEPEVGVGPLKCRWSLLHKPRLWVHVRANGICDQYKVFYNNSFTVQAS